MTNLREIAEDADVEELMRGVTDRNKMLFEQLEKEEQVESARGLTSTATHYTLYNRETGEPSTVIFDALRARLRQRFPDDHPNPKFAGKKVYTFDPEEAPRPYRGILACPLSGDASEEDAAERDSLGFSVSCAKPAYFADEGDVDLHVEKSHKRFYARRERERIKKEQDEWREEQRTHNALLEELVRQRPAPAIGSGYLQTVSDANTTVTITNADAPAADAPMTYDEFVVQDAEAAFADATSDWTESDLPFEPTAATCGPECEHGPAWTHEEAMGLDA